MSLLSKVRPTTVLVIGVLIGLVLALAAPAVGTQVRRAFDAQNADKVDGKHAVGAKASVAKRTKRLVATNAEGRLPNDIIAKAPDADRLDGVDADDYRVLQLETGAADLQGGATHLGSIRLPDEGTPSFGWSWVLPPDYEAGSPVVLELYVVPTAGGTASSVQFARQSATFGRPGTTFDSAAPTPLLPNSGSLATLFPQRLLRYQVTLVPPSEATEFRPGDALGVALRRQAESDTNDGLVFIRNAIVRY